MCIETMYEIFDCARFVRVDIDRGIIYVWKGGHTVNLWNDMGSNYNCYSIGDFSRGSATPQEVEESVNQRIEKGMDE